MTITLNADYNNGYESFTGDTQLSGDESDAFVAGWEDAERDLYLHMGMQDATDD